MTCKRISAVLAFTAILCLTLSLPAAAQDKEQGKKAGAQEKAQKAQMSKQAQMQKDVQRMQELGQKLTKIREEAINSNPELKKSWMTSRRASRSCRKKASSCKKTLKRP